MPRAVPRTNNFDALRLLAATVVVYGHAFPLTKTAQVVILGNSVESLAVKVFFVISGYLISESWLRDPQINRFLIRRALRIFPALIVVVLLSVLVLGPLATTLSIAGYFGNISVLMYLKNIFLYPVYYLPGVFQSNPYPIAVNGSLWSLPVEFSMYLLTPLLLLNVGGGRRLRVSAATLAFCAASLYFIYIDPHASRVVVYGTNLLFALDACPYFLIGACFRIWGWDRRADPQGALLVACILACVPEGGAWCEMALLLGLPYIVIGFANAQPARFGAVSRIGDLSYGTYLYGFPVTQMVAKLHPTIGAIDNFLVSLPLTLALAAASWFLVERRLLAMKPRRVSRAAEPTVPEVAAAQPVTRATLGAE